MRPLRYSINVSLDGCVDHAAAGFVTGPEVHEHAGDWLTSLGLIDEIQLVVHPVLAGHGPYLFDGLDEPLRLTETGRDELPDGVVAIRYAQVAHG